MRLFFVALKPARIDDGDAIDAFETIGEIALDEVFDFFGHGDVTPDWSLRSDQSTIDY